MVIPLTDGLRTEYQRLFDTCEIREDRQSVVEGLIASLFRNKDRYRSAGATLGIPWYFVATVHNMESSQNFSMHLHNGDPLAARTVHVPAGRPLAGAPPFSWEDSARDALTLEGLDKVSDWTIPGLLYQLEKYNGFGYRTGHPETLSPYLWSFSGHYTSGKFIEDGKFDPDAKSQQCGGAILLRRMAEKGMIAFDSKGNPLPDATPPAGGTLSSLEPLVVYSDTQASDAARALQRALNTMPGIFLRIDGVPGRRTSDAFSKATGHFLKGDPRTASAAASG